MKTISASLQTHLESAATTLCTCWKITRQDGQIFGYTDHDLNLTIDGLVYKSESGYFRSAIASSSETNVDNVDVEGFLDDAEISEVELRYGKFDYATVEIFVTNWADLTQGIVAMRYGMFGETVISSSGLFRIELRGLTQLFSQQIVDVYTPECRADFGDEKCGVSLIPEQHRTGSIYALNDRVVVPASAAGFNTDIRFPNNDFEIIRHSASLNESGGADGYATNEDGITGEVRTDDLWEYRTLTRAGIYQDTIFYTTMNDIASVSGAAPSNFVNYFFRMTVDQGTDYIDEEITIVLRRVDLAGASDSVTITAVDPASNDIELTIPYIANEDLEVVMTITNPMANGAAVTESVFTFSSARFQVETDSFGTISVHPPIYYFEPLNSTYTESHWWAGGYSASIVPASVMVSPYQGDRMLIGSTNTVATWYYSYPNADVDLAAITNIDLADLDAGLYTLNAGYWATAIGYGMRSRVRIIYYDTGMVEISRTWSDTIDLISLRNWKETSFSGVIPSGTRYIRFHIGAYRISDAETSNIYFDAPYFKIQETAYIAADEFDRYGGVEFKATTAGVSSTTRPVFDFTLGNTTADGTAVWTAISPVYTASDAITSVTDTYTFVCSNLAGIYADDYFNWGVLEWLDGDNTFLSMEIDDYIGASGTFTFKLPMPYAMVIGDKFKVHAGCDKSRTNCKVFNNIINFRGEPDVPGNDRYFKVAGV